MAPRANVVKVIHVVFGSCNDVTAPSPGHPVCTVAQVVKLADSSHQNAKKSSFCREERPQAKFNKQPPLFADAFCVGERPILVPVYIS